MKIRIEASSLLKSSITGVGYYTRSLVDNLKKREDVSVESFTLSVKNTSPQIRTVKGFSRQIYVKLNQFKIAPKFDSQLNEVDLTIFPDFALWPTSKSLFNAVVIHDLTYMKYPEYMRMRSIGPIKIPVTSWYLSSVVKTAVKKADFIITVSETSKKDIIKHFNINEDKIIVTEIPPSDTFLGPQSTFTDKSSLLKKYSIPTNNYILSVGTIEPRKNQLATLNAYLLLPTEIREKYSLVFAGGAGWSSDSFLTELTIAQKNNENIVLTGYFNDDDRESLFKHATLFTSASHYEGFGMPVLEAMKAKIATVLSDIPVYQEITNGSSLYINPADSQEYAAKIALLLKNPDLRNKYITSGKLSLSRYSWESNIDRIISKTKQLEQESNT